MKVDMNETLSIERGTMIVTRVGQITSLVGSLLSDEINDALLEKVLKACPKLELQPTREAWRKFLIQVFKYSLDVLEPEAN